MKKKHRVSIQNKKECYELRILSPCSDDCDIVLVSANQKKITEAYNQYSFLGFDCRVRKSQCHNYCILNKIKNTYPLIDGYGNSMNIFITEELESDFDSYLYEFYKAADSTMQSLINLYINKKDNNQIFQSLTTIAMGFLYRNSKEHRMKSDFFIDELSVFKNMVNEILSDTYEFLPFD